MFAEILKILSCLHKKTIKNLPELSAALLKVFKNIV